MDTLSESPLMLAAKYNQNPEVITILLKAGADIKAKVLSGATALMWAAGSNQNPEVTTTLRKAGANAALGNQNPEVIIILLNAGADAKVKDEREQMALDYAQQNYALTGTDALKKLEEASK